MDFLVPDFPKSSLTECHTFGCLNVSKAIDWYLSARAGIAAFNIFVAITLAFLFKKQFRGNRSKTNKVILITAISAIIFDFFPHLTSLLLIKIWKISTENIGPYSLLLGALDSGICAVLYFKVYSNKVKTTTRLFMIVTPPEPTPT
uniref:Uncharacterized protein n=1 Tax=Panagrolaimus sp. PS1159 TaxID=55785 RepID=A0AC35FA29_9BILA